MNDNVHYATVTDAINKLRQQGYTIDFNIDGECLMSNSERFGADDFHIADTYRYEGNSDPGDEATVYAIESKSGLKGILVTGYGMSADTASTELLKKLHF